jgi:hypothetical protein
MTEPKDWLESTGQLNYAKRELYRVHPSKEVAYATVELHPTSNAAGFPIIAINYLIKVKDLGMSTKDLECIKPWDIQETDGQLLPIEDIKSVISRINIVQEIKGWPTPISLTNTKKD